jgi:Sec-independent protein translocase protein TatA
LTLEFRQPGEASPDTNQQHFLPPPKSPHTTSRPKQGLLSELSYAQSLTARLHRDRDNWRSLAQKQERDFTFAHHNLSNQVHRTSNTEEQNTKLQFRHEEDTKAGRHLYARFQILVFTHDKLVDEFNDAMRTVARLKKSDRNKEKVQQRNFRLKAMLQRYTAQGTSAADKADADTEDTLREALALASERIEELEIKGEAVLDAVGRCKDGCGCADGEGMCCGDVEAGMWEARVAFRGVLDDEAVKERKVVWLDLLED